MDLLASVGIVSLYNEDFSRDGSVDQLQCHAKVRFSAANGGQDYFSFMGDDSENCKEFEDEDSSL